jgi:cyanophycinase-like exopeptidase
VRIILLGPQRRPTIDAVARSLGLDGPVATISAGWQEQELDYGELSSLLGGRDINVALYGRWLDVQERDPEFAAGERRLAEVVAGLAELYLVRLDYALQAVRELQRRDGAAGNGDGAAVSAAVSAALDDAVAAVRALDEAHLRRVNEVRAEFFAAMAPHDRPVIAAHRAAVAGLLRESTAVAMAGGHVGVLADLLHLFNVAAALREARSDDGELPVIAWSAGAMALTDRIVLFNDRAPQGPGHPEVAGTGLSLLREVVLLPHARTRLALHDQALMAVFARRFAPARCVLLEQGTRIDTSADSDWPGGARVIGADGVVVA